MRGQGNADVGGQRRAVGPVVECTVQGPINPPEEAAGRTWEDRPTLGEAGLIARAQAGDLSAFDPLYRTYGPSMIKYAVSLLSGRWATAEDAASEAWLAAMEQIDKYEPRRGRTFGAWLATLVRYQAFNAWRRPDRINAAAEVPAGAVNDGLTDALRPLWAVDADEMLDEQQAETREQRLIQIRAAVGRLSAQQRTVVTLRLEGLRTAEIARQLGVTGAAVDCYWERAVSLLRPLVGAALKPPRRLAPAAARALRDRAEFDKLLLELAGQGLREVRVMELASRFPSRSRQWVHHQVADVMATDRVPGVRLRRLHHRAYALHPVAADRRGRPKPTRRIGALAPASSGLRVAA